MIRFQVNGKPVAFEGPPETPLLWVLRDDLQLTGAKYGCGIGRCGACTVHVGGEATTSCTLRVGELQGMEILTIEGLAGPDGDLHPVQQAWIDEDVPQCGYCQPGQIMTAVDLLARQPNPSDDDIARHMSNLCRCGTYVRIRKAIHRAAGHSAEDAS
jgi:isoquinoline 1-oxidoreductase alpha subunit